MTETPNNPEQGPTAASEHPVAGPAAGTPDAGSSAPQGAQWAGTSPTQAPAYASQPGAAEYPAQPAIGSAGAGYPNWGPGYPNPGIPGQPYQQPQYALPPAGATTGAGWQGEAPQQNPWPPRTGRLLRSRSDRLLGGVCGGLARYWNTDPVLLRILAVVITLFTGGMFVLVYLLAWLVIPIEAYAPIAPTGTQPSYAAGGNPAYAGYPAEYGQPGPPPERSHLGWLVLSVAVLVAGVMGVISLFVSDKIAMGAITLGIVLGILGIGLLIGTTRGRARWLVIPAIPLAFITFAAVSAANWTANNPDWGNWTSKGVSVGERTWTVTPAEAQRGNLDYQLSMGSATLDLTPLAAPNGAGGKRVPIQASVGMGELIVLVPDNVELVLDATVNTGEVSMPVGKSRSTDAVPRNSDGGQAGGQVHVKKTLPAVTGDPGYVIELDANVGVGQVEVRHEASRR